MPKERLEKALKQREMISDEDYAKVIGLANIVRPVRSFLFKTPDVYGMTYEERFIPSIDGVPIEMWYIPVKGAPSDKLVIFNPALPKMKVALYSQCMGVNSQYHAIYRRPELFENVRCMSVRWSCRWRPSSTLYRARRRSCTGSRTRRTVSRTATTISAASRRRCSPSSMRI